MNERKTVIARDGWPLAVTLHPAVGARRGAVVLLHAMMVDARSLDRPAGAGLATVLSGAGWEVWRADLRGHGASGPAPREGGRWSYDDIVRNDIPALVDAAKMSGGEIVIIGHSLGGHTAAAAVAEGLVVDRLVLLATNVWMPSLEPSLRRTVQKTMRMALFEASAWPLGFFPSRRMRMGPADESLPYVRDLCRFWWQDQWGSRDGINWFRLLQNYRGRVLAVAAQGDLLFGHPDATRRWISAFTSASLTYWVAGRRTFGLSYDPDHLEIACDARSLPLWERIAVWMAS